MSHYNYLISLQDPHDVLLMFQTTFKLQQNYEIENHNYQTDHESTQSWFENSKEKCVSYICTSSFAQKEKKRGKLSIWPQIPYLSSLPNKKQQQLLT